MKRRGLVTQHYSRRSSSEQRRTLDDFLNSSFLKVTTRFRFIPNPKNGLILRASFSQCRARLPRQPPFRELVESAVKIPNRKFKNQQVLTVVLLCFAHGQSVYTPARIGTCHSRVRHRFPPSMAMHCCLSSTYCAMPWVHLFERNTTRTRSIKVSGTVRVLKANTH